MYPLRGVIAGLACFVGTAVTSWRAPVWKGSAHNDENRLSDGVVRDHGWSLKSHSGATAYLRVGATFKSR